ncbi:helix-turn-helix domain-containing protein [Halostagnicola kamekurae]|uniref:Predicted DNA binding protein, contains HTH domain n=1 Tax=Halostagnicola kamekurae TaxID=619731 RepID=A0A1I6QLG9_9EURY|nr:helix-turn-helix domain-containing protein [Halostagnicola kamekurae]SFS53327.1 Predicted DNA binding protein, contains HTH domain [Halostagnicola kamekurae]
MGFISEVHVVHDDLLLVPTIKRHPEATIKYKHDTVVDGSRLYFVSVFTEDYDALEETMVTDETVAASERVATFENRAIYRVTADAGPDIVPDACIKRGIYVFSIVSGDPGWIVRLHLPDRSALADFQEYCREYGVSFRIKQLYESTASTGESYLLTEQQREILSIAYFSGYYDIPRSVSQDYLAERLEISNSAVSQRLRRAIAQLLRVVLEEQQRPRS